MRHERSLAVHALHSFVGVTILQVSIPLLELMVPFVMGLAIVLLFITTQVFSRYMAQLLSRY